MSEVVAYAPTHEIIAKQLAELGMIDNLPPIPAKYDGTAKNGDRFTLMYYYIVHYQFDGIDDTVPQEGVYARLIIESPEKETKPFYEPIKQYWYSKELDYWTDDGETKSPRLVWNIGHSSIQ